MKKIIISNYVLTEMGLNIATFEHDVISRVNLAWMKDVRHAKDTLLKIDSPIFLDYPHGRSKPPRPNMTLEDAMNLMDEVPNVKYFAISNVEEHENMRELRDRLPKHVELVPKIETKRGIRNLASIIEGASTKTLMLDKEDLYNDVDRDVDLFEILIESARITADKFGVTLLELRGVVFA